MAAVVVRREQRLDNAVTRDGVNWGCAGTRVYRKSSASGISLPADFPVIPLRLANADIACVRQPL